MTLDAALAEAVRILEERGIPSMVIGGLAVLQWGEPRSTLDIDITAAAEDDALVDVAQEIGTILVDDPASFVARARVLPIRLGDGTRLDLIAATLPFEHEAITRARPIELGGRTVRVCAPEDLIIHKIVSDRERDVLDVSGIIRRQADALDLEGLRTTIRDLAEDLDAPEILERFQRAEQEARG